MEEELTLEEEQLNNDMKNNYIVNFATLVADNIASTYSRLGNNYNTSLSTTIKESEDTFPLADCDHELLYRLISNSLMDKHKLKIIKEDKLIIDELH